VRQDRRVVTLSFFLSTRLRAFLPFWLFLPFRSQRGPSLCVTLATAPFRPSCRPKAPLDEAPFFSRPFRAETGGVAPAMAALQPGLPIFSGQHFSEFPFSPRHCPPAAFDVRRACVEPTPRCRTSLTVSCHSPNTLPYLSSRDQSSSLSEHIWETGEPLSQSPPSSSSIFSTHVCFWPGFCPPAELAPPLNVDIGRRTASAFFFDILFAVMTSLLYPFSPPCHLRRSVRFAPEGLSS